ncbi:hypothetical protein ARZXY2_1486 [Arthrobacter sp. ZXY-2]|nr:hypothetical protein ARZXY2_1486 [Arthrobacter sp. ZXY-2]
MEKLEQLREELKAELMSETLQEIEKVDGMWLYMDLNEEPTTEKEETE